MAAQQLGGGLLGEQHGGARRDRAGIDGIEIAAGGQHVGAAARRRAGGAGAHEFAVERGDERVALGLGRGVEAGGENVLRHAGIGGGKCGQVLGAAVGIGGAAEDVQPVPDLQILHVAEIGVEAGEPVVLAHVGLRARLAEEAQTVGAGQNFLAQEGRAAAIEPVGGGELIDQPLELGAFRPKARGLQRRGQMADGHRTQPALGGGGLARIVDDEGIDQGQLAEQRRGEAGARQGHRLAGQPFQRAMGAEMDQRMDGLDLAQPEIEGDIGVARRQIGVVVARFAVERIAAVGLDRGDELAVTREAQNEMPVAERGVVFRRAPGRRDLAAHIVAERRGEAAIIGKAQEGVRRRLA